MSSVAVRRPSGHETTQAFARPSPRVEVEVPEDLAAELARDTVASAAWEKLSVSRQRAHAELITGAKTDDTQAKRVAKVLAALHG